MTSDSPSAVSATNKLHCSVFASSPACLHIAKEGEMILFEFEFEFNEIYCFTIIVKIKLNSTV